MSSYSNTGPEQIRNLIIVLGDQMNEDSAAFEGFDKTSDAVWMAESSFEAAYVWSHKLRIAYFFSAMRHFRDLLRQKNFHVFYHELSGNRLEDRGNTLVDVLKNSLKGIKPQKLIMAMPGDYRVLQDFKSLSKETGLHLETRDDWHFYLDIDEFGTYAKGKKKILLEMFYRYMRKKHGILLEKSSKPIGGSWNFDRENRKFFGRDGPGHIDEPLSFSPDKITQEVVELVRHRFAGHPGNLNHFRVPVTREDALKALDDFTAHRLPWFGTYEDAMWTSQPFLYHSRLSASLNIKLIKPQECIDAAVFAFTGGESPISSVEGFIRQILGWREFIRGIYWLYMPDYAEMNYLEHDLNIPSFFWTGETNMECVHQTMTSVIDYAYTHHIQRLMVIGLFALLFGVDPKKFHDWHMAMYLDAIDWVSLPNTLGMSQYADGGIVGTKPYCASGNYINKMSNYCRQCRFDYRTAYGEKACPFTTLYWDFLDRHYDRIRNNIRLAFQINALLKKRADKGEMNKIRSQAEKLKELTANV